MKRNITLLIIFMIATSIQSFSQQASLTIINKSDRYLTVKIMKGPEKKATLYKTDVVSPKGKQIIYFNETGRYFTKSQAVLINKDTLIGNDTLFSKEKPFEVIADQKRGYSNITMKYIVKESKKSSPQDAISITSKEYKEN